MTFLMRMVAFLYYFFMLYNKKNIAKINRYLRIPLCILLSVFQTIIIIKLRYSLKIKKSNYFVKKV